MDWKKLQWIDVRILYAIIVVCLLIPMFRPVGLPVAISDNTRNVYDTIAAVPDGGAIWISHDTGSGNAPELNPMIKALARQAFTKNCKLISTSLFSQTYGPQATFDLIDEVSRDMGKEYGVDWVHLGYRDNAWPATIRLMVDNIQEGAINRDWKGEPLNTMPLMREVKSIKDDVDLIFVTTVGSPGYSDWMTYVSEPLHMPLTGGASLTMYSGVQQYIRSGQLQGFLGGLRGAAEYEQLVDAPGEGLAGMDAQSLGHMTVIAFLVLGNIGYFVSKRTAKKD
jgi:hypothetical protein